MQEWVWSVRFKPAKQLVYAQELPVSSAHKQDRVNVWSGSFARVTNKSEPMPRHECEVSIYTLLVRVWLLERLTCNFETRPCFIKSPLLVGLRLRFV